MGHVPSIPDPRDADQSSEGAVRVVCDTLAMPSGNRMSLDGAME